MSRKGWIVVVDAHPKKWWPFTVNGSPQDVMTVHHKIKTKGVNGQWSGRSFGPVPVI